MAMNIKRILIFLLLLNFKVFANELYNDNEGVILKSCGLAKVV